MLYLGTIRLEFEETIVIFGISNFEFVKMQSFMLKKEELNLGQKNALFRYFWTGI